MKISFAYEFNIETQKWEFGFFSKDKHTFGSEPKVNSSSRELLESIKKLADEFSKHSATTLAPTSNKLTSEA